MMHHRPVARLNVHSADVAVMIKIRRNDVAAVNIAPVRFNMVCPVRLQHQVRLPQRPAFRVVDGSGKFFGIAFRRTRIHPADQRRHFVIRQSARVLKIARAGIRLPGRHPAALRVAFDIAAPGRRLGV